MTDVLFSEHYIQHITYIIFILLVIISGPSYLLSLKRKANEELKKLAMLDGVTKIMNRRTFFSLTQDLIKHCNEKHPISVVFIDLDYFKEVNDLYGHAFGDEVLEKVALVLKEVVRGGDYVCRYGGDEFIVLMSDTEQVGAIAVANNIQDHLRVLKTSNETFKLNASMGIVTTSSSDHSISRLLALADQALYKAKEKGRNCFYVYE